MIDSHRTVAPLAVLMLAAVAAPATAQLTPEEQANIRVYEAANQSVVHITTSTAQMHPLMGVIPGEGAGSGCVLDREGHILTNNHVIEGARKVEVAFSDDRVYEATIVGRDEEYDIAVLKIDAPSDSLNPIRLGRSEGLRVGQKAFALGNPFGLDGTLTTGIVSSLNRSLPSRADGSVMTGMIQTDAAMNPGNSGGPLLNSSAEMIGMCVAIRSSVGQNSGVGFAIPVDRVRRFVPELIKKGRIVRAYHGIVQISETPQGLRVWRVSDGSPADRAGLRGMRIVERRWREGPIVYREREVDRDYADLIAAVDGQPVSKHTEFIDLMDGYQPGDRVVFTVVRDGGRVDIPVTLSAT